MYTATISYPRNPEQAIESQVGKSAEEAKALALAVSAVNVSRRLIVYDGDYCMVQDTLIRPRTRR